MFIQTIAYILLPLVVTYITIIMTKRREMELVCAKAPARTSHTDISRGLLLHVSGPRTHSRSKCRKAALC